MVARGGRLTNIDVLKGIGICLMVMGHMHFSITFNHFIFGFHMPLFFIISGYLYRRPVDIKKYTIHKAKVLMTPYFVFGLVYILIETLKAEISVSLLKRSLFALFIKTTDGLAIESALWFLPALLWALVIFAFADVKITKEFIKLLIIIVITLFGCLCNESTGIAFPWGLSAGMSACGFVYLGYLFNEREEKIVCWINRVISKCNCLIIFIIYNILAVILACSILLNGKVNMRTGEWGILPITYINAAVFNFLLYLAADFIDKRFKCAKKVLSFIGKNSIVFVCTNHLVIRVVQKVVKSVLIQQSIIQNILIFIIAMSGMILVSEIINNTHLRKIIGK